ncbi:MAG TPA: ParB/RepB/Spo0J family partition protein [Acetobacteraceae bacterium]|nr:ParB/RepB/Spo0J family partition protein [Acetobacteraceae bacterium]
MALGNRGFAQGLAGTIAPPAAGARLPPRTGLLADRENRLAQLAAGNSLTRFQELVDPARCRIWEGHNRDYAALSEATCADLIESFKAEGRQNFPAIVRRVEGDPAHDWEVICGARRHWTASWMRARHQPDFRFLVEPRELTDEEAFRLADLENRSRRDLSDYERARDYARAVERYYGGSQQQMAERLEVSRSWLSRYLELARLPAEIVAAFASPQAIGISHAAILAPLLRADDQRDRIIAEAGRLAVERADLVTRGELPLSPAGVVQRLTNAGRPQTMIRRADVPREHVVRSPEGSVVARGQRGGRGGGITISIPAPTKHARAALVSAVEEILDRMGQTAGRAARRADR